MSRTDVPTVVANRQPGNSELWQKPTLADTVHAKVAVKVRTYATHARSTFQEIDQILPARRTDGLLYLSATDLALLILQIRLCALFCHEYVHLFANQIHLSLFVFLFLFFLILLSHRQRGH